MPYKFETDKIPLPKGKDRRVRLTPEQRAEIRENVDGLSQRALANKYKVSRRLVQFILQPDKHAQNLKCRQDRGGWQQYYDKNKHKDAMREHRQYKKSALLSPEPTKES